MRYTAIQVIEKLAKTNNDLARVSRLHEKLESILDDLHDGDKEHFESLKQARENKDHEEAKRLKKLVEDSVSDCNNRLKKANYGLFNLNTFEFREGKNINFDSKINSFISALSEERELFLEEANSLFSKDGKFNRKNTLLFVSCEINKVLSAKKTVLKEMKRAYNQESFRNNGKQYLVEIASSKKDEQTDSQWLAALRDKPTFKQYHEERKSHYIEKCGAKKSEASRLADNDLYLEIAKAYLRGRDACYFNDIFATNKTLARDLIALKEKCDANQGFAQFKSGLVMKAIFEELSRHRRVYLAITLKEKKSKTTALMVSQWSTSVALLSAIGQACLSAYAVAGALGYTAASGNLMAYLNAHPAAMAAVVAVFASVLLTNMIMYNTFVKSLFGLFAKGRMLKNKDGTKKEGFEKKALWVGLGVSALTALGGAAVAFNGCQAMFAGVFSASTGAIPVVAVSLVIAAITFFALTSFNFQFFYAILADFKAYKKQMERTFLKGRSKVGKGILLGLCVLMTALFTVGSFMVNVASIKGMLTEFSVRAKVAEGLAYTMTVINTLYFIVSSFGSNRDLLMMFRAKINKFTAFCKKVGAGHVAGNVAAKLLRFPLEILFFAASVVLLTFRLGIAAVKTVMNIISTVMGVFAGLVTLVEGKSFAKGFKAVATLPERGMTHLHKKTGAWWDMTFMYCVKRGGMLGVLLNAGSQAALRMNNMNSINMAITAPTMAVSAGLSSTANAGAMEYTVKSHSDAKAGERDLLEGTKANSGSEPSKHGFFTGLSSGLWSDFLASAREEGDRPKSA